MIPNNSPVVPPNSQNFQYTVAIMYRQADHIIKKHTVDGLSNEGFYKLRSQVGNAGIMLEIDPNTWELILPHSILQIIVKRVRVY